MKNYKNAIIFLLVFAILLAGYLLYGKKFDKTGTDSSNNTSTSEVKKKVVEIDRSKIESVDIKYNSKLIQFDCEAGNLKLKSPQIAKVDQSVISNIEYSLTNMNYDKLIAEKSQNIDQFGLKTPSMSVVVNFEGIVKKVLYVGNMTPSKELYYVKLEDSDKVYAVSKEIVENFMVDENKLKSKELFSFRQENIDYVQLQKNGIVSFEVKKSKSEKDNWDIISPVQAVGDNSKITTIISSAIGLKVSKFVSDTSNDLALYGLDKPVYSLQLGAGKETVKLLVGKEKIEDQEVYAKFSDSADVFTINSTAFDFKDTSVQDIISIK